MVTVSKAMLMQGGALFALRILPKSARQVSQPPTPIVQTKTTRLSAGFFERSICSVILEK